MLHMHMAIIITAQPLVGRFITGEIIPIVFTMSIKKLADTGNIPLLLCNSWHKTYQKWIVRSANIQTP